MSSAPCLFVYGTLKSSFAHNRFSRYLAANADLLGPARMNGRLYGLKRYPAMRLPQSVDDWVTGEVYRLRKPQATLATLDAYEDRDYRRLRREAWLINSGTQIDGRIQDKPRDDIRNQSQDGTRDEREGPRCQPQYPTTNKTRVKCWVYVWERSLARWRRVESGEWSG